MQSIRAHLAESALVSGGEPITVFSRADDKEFSAYRPETSDSLVKMFSERLESVGGNCVVARDEDQAARLLTQIISDLNQNGAAKRIALSDAPLLSALTRGIAVEELEVCPPVTNLFDYDVGVTATDRIVASRNRPWLKLGVMTENFTANCIPFDFRFIAKGIRGNCPDPSGIICDVSELLSRRRGRRRRRVARSSHERDDWPEREF